jgi:chromosome segregation ATPase
MSDKENNIMSGESQSGFWSRLSKATRWLFLTLLRLAIIVLIVVGLVATIWFMVDQINRVTRLNNRLNVMSSELDLLSSQEERRRTLVGELQSTIVAQEGRLATVESSLGTDLLLQGDLLVTLEAQVDGLLTSSQSISQSLTSLAAGLVALQRDVNDNGGRIDALGGEIDSWQADVAVMRLELAELAAAGQEPDNELVRLRRSVALFYIWELIARARLRLIENNPGLAATDIEQASKALVDLAALVTESEVEALRPVQSRLALAGDSLPADPTAAARDLDAAWEEVGALLARLQQSETGLLEAGTAAAPAAATTPEGTAAPEGAATPENEVTPVPTVSPTTDS